jgi:transposase-like protein
MPRRYPSEFRRRVLDLVAAGRSVVLVAADLGVSAQTIYNWRRQTPSTVARFRGCPQPRQPS